MSLYQLGYTGTRLDSGNLSQIFQSTSVQSVGSGTTGTLITSFTAAAQSQSSAGAVSIGIQMDSGFSIPLAGYYLVTVSSLFVGGSSGSTGGQVELWFDSGNNPTLAPTAFGNDVHYNGDTDDRYSVCAVAYYPAPGSLYVFLTQNLGAAVNVGHSGAPNTSLTIQRLNGPPLAL